MCWFHGCYHGEYTVDPTASGQLAGGGLLQGGGGECSVQALNICEHGDGYRAQHWLFANRLLTAPWPPRAMSVLAEQGTVIWSTAAIGLQAQPVPSPLTGYDITAYTIFGTKLLYITGFPQLACIKISWLFHDFSWPECLKDCPWVKKLPC